MDQRPRFALRHSISDGIAIIDGDELHHLRDVMRIRPGAEVTLLDDRMQHAGRVESIGKERATVRIESSHRANDAPALVLAAAIIKGPRMDFLIEKAAELGVSEVWPMLCARGVVREPGDERIE